MHGIASNRVVFLFQYVIFLLPFLPSHEYAYAYLRRVLRGTTKPHGCDLFEHINGKDDLASS